MARRPQRKESVEDLLARMAATFDGPPNVNRYQPHPKQDVFHRLKAKHRLFLGGNRSGKSVAGTVEGIYRARGEHPSRPVPPGPTRGRVIGTDFPMGIEKVLLPLWAQWTPPSLLVNGSWEDSFYHGQDGRILTLANGSTVEFMSMEQSVNKFAGASRHWVHFDEEPPKDIYDESRARLIDTDGDWWMTLTPVLGLDYIYDDVYVPGKLAMEHPEELGEAQIDAATGLPLFGVVEVESYENTHLQRSALDGFFATLDASSAQTRRSGRFVQVTGAVWPDFHRTTHVIPPVFRPREGYHRIFVSIDNGWRDHTAVLWHAVDPHDNVTTFAEVYVNETLIRDICVLIKRMSERWGIGRPYVYVGDPRGLRKRNEITGTNALMEFARGGIPIATKGINGDVEFGVQRMTQYLRARRDPVQAEIMQDLLRDQMYLGEDGIDGGPIYQPRTEYPKWLVTTDCPNLIRQLEKNRWRRRAKAADEQSLNKLVEMVQSDNHSTDSARFFFVMMPDLAPKDTQKKKSGRMVAEVADMLGAVKPDTHRDPKLGDSSKGWSYRPVGEFDGWEEG